MLTFNFNPTLVQLELRGIENESYLPPLFQSHIGAIRIIRRVALCRNLKQFQSHIGAIRIGSTTSKCSFASSFQSHIGAIRIW